MLTKRSLSLIGCLPASSVFKSFFFKNSTTSANNGFIPKKIKKEMNGRELTAILEENKVDLSFSDSD